MKPKRPPDIEQGTCSTPGCPREKRPGGPECTVCRGNILGWARLSVPRVLTRVRRLGMYSFRMAKVQRIQGEK